MYEPAGPQVQARPAGPARSGPDLAGRGQAVPARPFPRVMAAKAVQPRRPPSLLTHPTSGMGELQRPPSRAPPSGAAGWRWNFAGSAKQPG
jgi:hypothetical protein